MTLTWASMSGESENPPAEERNASNPMAYVKKLRAKLQVHAEPTATKPRRRRRS